MPTAYPATNFHTENISQFVADVDKATGGKLKITVHANASLFKAPEIKRAVQGDQAQAGEILLVNFENEDPMFGIDGVPFLATGYGDAMKLVQGVEQGARRQARQAGHEAAVYGAVAAAGHLHQEDAEQRRRHEGPQVARVQSGDVEDRRAGRRATGDGAGRRAVAGAGHRRHRFVHVVAARPASTPRPTSSIKNFYDTQAWLPKNAVIVNQKAFDALDKATQDAVLKAAADAEARGWKASEEKNGWYIDQLKQKGMTIVKPSAQLTADLQQGRRLRCSPSGCKQGRPDGQAAVDAFRKM